MFAGAAQFAAVGYVASGLAWPAIILLTALLNARHLLYSAALAPWLRGRPVRPPRGHGPPADRRGVRAVDRPLPAARPDRRVGLLDRRDRRARSSRGTWRRSAGVLLGGQIPDPARFGIDIIFPAAMIGLAVGLITGRARARRRRSSAPASASSWRSLTSPSVGIIVGGLVGPLVGLARAGRARPRDRAARDAGVGRALLRCPGPTSPTATTGPARIRPTRRERPS